jgi:hypothetical protein
MGDIAFHVPKMNGARYDCATQSYPRASGWDVGKGAPATGFGDVAGIH